MADKKKSGGKPPWLNGKDEKKDEGKKAAMKPAKKPKGKK